MSDAEVTGEIRPLNGTRDRIVQSPDSAGVALNQRGRPQDLSHANLYAVAQPVPEPETYALMMAGLAAVGFLSRRRKSGSRQ